MIHAYISADQDGHFLQVDGHADYDAEGKDIVCSAVSAVAQSLAFYLQATPGVRADTVAKKGDMRVISGHGDTVHEAFRLTAIGLAEIAKQYPQHVKVSIVGM